MRGIVLLNCALLCATASPVASAADPVADEGMSAMPQQPSEDSGSFDVAVRLIPFGVGQFLNGDDALGAYFLGTEASLLFVNLFGYIGGEHLRRERSCLERGVSCAAVARRFEQYRALNWTGLAGFAGHAVVGVVEGLMSAPEDAPEARPSLRTLRIRPLLQIEPGFASVWMSGTF